MLCYSQHSHSTGSGGMEYRDMAVQTGDTMNTMDNLNTMDNQDTMDRAVVKYSEDHIVTITVPGHDAHGDHQEILDSLAIVAHNTLRLRIIPGKEYEYYQEISDNGDVYDYCEEEQIPPPLPPRDTFLIRKQTMIGSCDDNNAGMERSDKTEAIQEYRKDLRKYLGITKEDTPETMAVDFNFKKNLSKFLGVEQKCLRKVLTSHKKDPNQDIQTNFETSFSASMAVAGSEGYSSTYLSSSSSGSCTTSLEYYAASDRLL